LGFIVVFDDAGRLPDATLRVRVDGAAPLEFRTAAPPADENWRALADLSGMLLQPGDLPEGAAGGLVEDVAELPPPALAWGGMPEPIGLASARIDGREGAGMIVTAALYSRPEDVLSLYNQVALYRRAEPLPGVGERAAFHAGLDHFGAQERAEAAFTRCNAAVYLRGSLFDDRLPLSREQLVAYLRRLDDRLRALACP
ncbi:MAG TPA: hypothetical protein VGE07_13125, partial [Herpetosiphonaceae bacterium]